MPVPDPDVTAASRLAPADVPVVILCGGLGTRLRAASDTLPKPLVDIGGRPILWHIMKLYGAHGFRRFVLALGYKSDDIKHYFLRFRENLADFTIRLHDEHAPTFHNQAGDEDWEVTCVETGLTTGTGARISRVRRYVDADVFAVTYGDGIGDVDLASALAFHQSHDAVGTVTGVHPTSRYGEMHVAGDRVTEFNEKPTMADGFVSGGFFFFDRPFFDYLADDPGLFLEAEPLRKLAADSQLRVRPHEGFWMGMDTPRDHAELNQRWADGDAPWKVWPDTAPNA